MLTELLIPTLSIPISASIVFVLSYLYLFRHRLKTVKGRKAYKIGMVLYLFSVLSVGMIYTVAIIMSSSSVENSSPPPDTFSILFLTFQDVLIGSAEGFFLSAFYFAIIRGFEKIFAKK